jgi:hypothetical protein
VVAAGAEELEVLILLVVAVAVVAPLLFLLLFQLGNYQMYYTYLWVRVAQAAELLQPDPRE